MRMIVERVPDVIEGTLTTFRPPPDEIVVLPRVPSTMAGSSWVGGKPARLEENHAASEIAFGSTVVTSEFVPVVSVPAHSLGELMAAPAVTQVPATSLSLPRQIEVVPGGLLLQFNPCEEVSDATTSPLIVSGAAAFPLPIKTVVPPTLPGHPTDPGQGPGETFGGLTFTRFFRVTSLELRTAKWLAAP